MTARRWGIWPLNRQPRRGAFELGFWPWVGNLTQLNWKVQMWVSIDWYISRTTSVNTWQIKTTSFLQSVIHFLAAAYSDYDQWVAYKTRILLKCIVYESKNSNHCFFLFLVLCFQLLITWTSANSNLLQFPMKVRVIRIPLCVVCIWTVCWSQCWTFI